MNKQEFLAELRKGLTGLPQVDIEERISFYSEMIDDRIEEGLSEAEAVSAIGPVSEVVSQILADTPIRKLVKEKVQPSRTLRAWEIVLLVLGSPIWLSLLAAALVIILSLYAVLWSVVISLWAAFGTVAGCAIGGIVAGIVFAMGGNALTGIAMIGAGIFCAGLSIFMFYACKAATKGTIILSKKICLGIKRCFVRKEEA